MAALVAVPAGRIADRFGAVRTTLAGLWSMAAGCAALALLPAASGVPGYITPIVVVTAGYALFQTANTTAVLSNVAADERGILSGLLNLSRNLGLITGASAMGAVFAFAAAARDLAAAPPEAVARAMRITFAVAAALIAVALATAAGLPRGSDLGSARALPGRRRPGRHTARPDPVSLAGAGAPDPSSAAPTLDRRTS